ncbi:MAG TPA: GNAT family N-acetyltransferase [Candidatus Latescibacteria bacterium]|nr:GNAT family N-acetyltransferase [Candidatus Latescibacterota bacterium]
MMRRVTLEHDVRSLQEACEGIVPDERVKHWTVEKRSESWRRVFSDPAVCTCLAEEAGVAVGWISFGKSRDEDAVNCGEVYGLHAHPDHWGHGIGGKELWALRYSTAVPARSN